MTNTKVLGTLTLMAVVFAGLATVGPATIRSAWTPLRDADGDRVLDAMESELCDRDLGALALSTSQTGRCASSTDWIPPEVAQETFVPTEAMLGTDEDQDGLPHQVHLVGHFVRIDPFSAVPILLTPGSRDVDVDAAPYGDDTNPQSPAPSQVGMLVAVPLGVEEMRDADRDDLPSEVRIKMVYLGVDRASTSLRNKIMFEDAEDTVVAVDTQDDDASSPAPHAVVVRYVPTDVWHDGDHDKDLIPHALTIRYLNITIDRRVDAPARASFEEATLTQTLDADDAAREDLVPWSALDADADFVPDKVEPVFCLVEKRSDARDGRCDDTRENYIPVEGAENPWRIHLGQAAS